MISRARGNPDCIFLKTIATRMSVISCKTIRGIYVHLTKPWGSQDYVPLYKNEQGCPGGFCPTLTQIIKGRMKLTISWLQLGRIYFILRIYHECEGRIEKSVPRFTDWHHEACRVNTNGDPKGQIFLSYPRANNDFFFIAYHCFFFFFFFFLF